MTNENAKKKKNVIMAFIRFFFFFFYLITALINGIRILVLSPHPLTSRGNDEKHGLFEKQLIRIILFYFFCLQAVKGELTGRRGSFKVTVNQMDHGSTSYRGRRGKTSKRIKQA